MVYPHLGTLYDLIPHTFHPTSDPARPAMEPPTDGVLSSVKTQPTAKSMKKKNQPAARTSQLVTPHKTASPSAYSIEVN